MSREENRGIPDRVLEKAWQERWSPDRMKIKIKIKIQMDPAERDESRRGGKINCPVTS
jgi:hypothetical protein